jgi:hypothetical protein
MCDDYFEGDFDDYDGFDNDGFDSESNHEDLPHDEPCVGSLEWQDWMIIGPLSSEIGEEEKEKDRIYRDTFGDDIFDIGP